MVSIASGVNKNISLFPERSKGENRAPLENVSLSIPIAELTYLKLIIHGH